MTHLQMYLFTSIEDILAVFVISLIFSSVILIIVTALLFLILPDCEERDKIDLIIKRFKNKFLFFYVLNIILVCFIPNQREVAAIWLVPKIINNEKITSITENSLSIINESAKKYLNNLLKDIKRGQ